MAVHIHRVTVRGRFRDLDDTSREALVASAHEHEAIGAAFTPTGTLTYDRAVDFFSFRFEVRTDDEVVGRRPSDVHAIGEQRAVDQLRRAALAHGPLKVQSTDMADVWSDG